MGNRDLKFICCWAIGMLLAVLVTDSWVIRGLIAAPLVLILIGHAVLRAIDFKTPSLAEHVIYAMGISIAVTVGGGFLLNLVALLTPLGWVLWLLAVVVAASLIGVHRETSIIAPVGLASWRYWHSGIIGIAILIAGGAYVLAVHDERNNLEFAYTEFWLLSPTPGKLLVGIKSGERETKQFDVEIIDDKGVVIALWNNIEINPHETWTNQADVIVQTGKPTTEPCKKEVALPIPVVYKAEAKLFLLPSHTIYRRVSAMISR